MYTRKRTLILFPVCLSCLILAVVLGGIWPGYSERNDRTNSQEDPEEFLVNDDFSSADQGYSDIGVDGIGNFWIVWQDNREGDYSTYAQYFAWDGERYGPNSPVNDDTGGDEQNDPHVGVSAAGYTKFVWQDFRVTGYPDNPDIYGQDINEDGSVNWANHRVNSDFGQAKQRKPNLDVSPTGAAVVVWEDYRLNNWDIYAQWYGSGGSTAGGNVKVNDDATNAVQHRPFVAADGLGNVLVCWYDNRSGDDEIFGQIYNSSRSPVGGNFLINETGAASKQKFPAAAGLPGGGFVVVWTDYRNGPYPTNPDVYAQIISPTGAPIGGNFRANDDGSGIEQSEPQVGSAPTGGFVICWRDERNGASDIYAQRYEPSGDPAETNFMVNAADAGVLQSSPAVAMSDAKMYFTWTDNRNGGLFDIYGCIITYDNPTISPIPSFIYFEAEDGGPNPPAQQIMVTNSGAGVLEWAAVDDANWLSLSQNFGTAPTAVDLLVNSTGLPIGDYSATITFTDLNDPEITGLATIDLRVEYGKPIIEVSPTVLEYEGGLIGAPPPPQQIDITNVGGKTLNWQHSVSDDWISLLPPTGTAPSTPLVYVDPGELEVGTHVGTLSILDPTSYNLQVDITITCEVIDNAPEIELSPSELYFLAYERQGNPPPQQVQITNIGYGALEFEVETGSSGLLDASPLSGTAPEYVDIWVFTDTLVPGDYYDTLWFIDTLAKNSPYGLPIHAEVGSVPPEIWLSEEELVFSGVRSQSNPPAAEFQIANTGGGTLHWLIEHSSSWLSCVPDTGTGPQAIQCQPDISISGSGEFADTIRVSDPAASNYPQTITVSLTVDEPDTLYLPIVTASPGQAIVVPVELINADSITDISLPLQYDLGYLQLDSAVFSGGRIAHWMFKSVAPDTIAGTVKFFATSHAVPVPNDPLAPGQGPVGFLHFSVSALTPGGTMMHIDTVTLDMSPLSLANAEGFSFVPRVVPGGVVVGVPPEISLTPTELVFAANRSGMAPPAQQFTINNTGGGTLAWTAASDIGWLTVNPDNGGGGQSITCTIDQSGLSAGEFSGNVFVTDPSAANSPQAVNIELTLAEPDTLRLPVVDALASQDMVIPVAIDNSEPIKELQIPLTLDPTYVRLDSVSYVGTRIADWPVLSAVVDSQAGTAVLTGSSTSTPLTPGNGTIGVVYLHLTPDAPGGLISEIDTTTVGGDGLLMVTDNDVSFMPRVVPGRVQAAFSPQILLTPGLLNYTAVRGGAAPTGQQFNVGNAGQGSLAWTASTTAGWISIDPATGGDDENVTCTVANSGLSSSEFYGNVTISDPTAGNSPQAVTIHLTLDEPDTLLLPVVDAVAAENMIIPIAFNNSDRIKEIQMPLAMNPTYIRLDSVSYVGTRIAGWPTLAAVINSQSGTVVLSGSSVSTPLAPGSGTVGVVHAHLTPGAPGGFISDIDTATIGGAGLLAVGTDDVSFIPRVVTGRVQAAFSPQISLTSTRLDFVAVRGGTAPETQQFTVNNTGGGSLSWTTSTASGWLSINPLFGGNGQSVTCAVDNSGMLSGVRFGSVIVADPGAGNSPRHVTIVFSILEPDTVMLPDLDAEPAQEVVVPVLLRNDGWLTELHVPLYFNPSYVFLDSASFIGSRIANWPSKSAAVDNQNGTAIFSGTATTTLLRPGSGIIGHVFLHVYPDISGIVILDMDSTTVGQTGLSLVDTNGIIFMPRMVPGRLQITGMTGIIEDPWPGQFDLPAIVNYPNPFNTETVIFIRGIVDPPAQLVIYDVLGRVIRDLSARLEMAGTLNRVVWDGADQAGRPLGTGMYFATLRTAQNYTTQKILLLR